MIMACSPGRQREQLDRLGWPPAMTMSIWAMCDVLGEDDVRLAVRAAWLSHGY